MSSSIASCKGCWWCGRNMNKHIFCSLLESSLTWTEKSIELTNQLPIDLQIGKVCQEEFVESPVLSAQLWKPPKLCLIIIVYILFLNVFTFICMKKTWDNKQTITLFQPCFSGDLTSASLPFDKAASRFDAPTFPVEMLLSRCLAVHLIELLQLISQWFDFRQDQLPRRQAPQHVLECDNML